jgi:DNA-3-methyladenine glycosylase
VYLSYGIHYLINAVTEPQGQPAAVLIRALQPLGGVPLMRSRRARGATLDEAALCRGPGNLTQAMGVSAIHNERDLTKGTLRIEDHGIAIGDVVQGPRIGIRVGTDRPWRFWVTGHPAVSGARGARTRMLR